MQSRINGACHATKLAGASAKPLRERADDVPTGCLERDCLDCSLLCSLCLRSERFSYVVVTRTASPQCPQRLMSTGAQLIYVKVPRTAPRYWDLVDPNGYVDSADRLSHAGWPTYELPFQPVRATAQTSRTAPA